MRASSTRCPRCYRQRYVRRDQPWEGPAGQLADAAGRAAEVNAREPVELTCTACRHRWTSRARPGGTVRCPACRHNRRVPSGPTSTPVHPPRPARQVPPPAPARTRPALPPTRQAPPRPVRVTHPAPARRVEPVPARRVQPPARPAPAPTGGLGAVLGSLLAGLRTPNPPRPADPQPARPAIPRRPVDRIAPTRVPGQPPAPYDLRQRTNPAVLASRLRALGVPLADPAEWRTVRCWIADRNARACGLTRTHVGTFVPGVSVELCQTHAEIISRRAAELGASVSVVLAD